MSESKLRSIETTDENSLVAEVASLYLSCIPEERMVVLRAIQVAAMEKMAEVANKHGAKLTVVELSYCTLGMMGNALSELDGSDDCVELIGSGLGTLAGQFAVQIRRTREGLEGDTDMVGERTTIDAAGGDEEKPEGPYNREVDADAETIIPARDWLDSVSDGSLTDYDGYGRPVMMARGKFWMDPGITLVPSGADELPSSATHVVWFNR